MFSVFRSQHVRIIFSAFLSCFVLKCINHFLSLCSPVYSHSFIDVACRVDESDGDSGL